MRRAAEIAAMVVVCAAGLAQASAQTLVPLRQVEVPNSSYPALAGCRVLLGPTQPDPPLQLPAGLPANACFAGGLGGNALFAAWDAQRADLLWLDTDRDGDLSRELPLRCVRTRSTGSARVHSFGPVAVAARQGATTGAMVGLEVVQYVGGTSYVRVFPATILTGSLPIGGRWAAVALVDADCDGVFAPAGLSTNGDWLAVDWDGNGKIDPNWQTSPELMPIPRMIALDNSYFTLEVDTAAGALRLIPQEPGLGTLDVGTPDAQLLVWSDYGAALLPPGGRWQLPEGSYRIQRITLIRQGVRGGVWRLDSSDPGSASTFTIPAGQTQAVRLGAPLVAEGLLSGAAPSVQVSMTLTGQGGEEYLPGATRNGRTAPAPKFQVIDENGRRLVSGQFEYG